MIRLLTILLILILPLQLLASHIVGGEMYYDCLGNDQYKITVKVYRDCNSDGAEFDNQIILGIFNRLNNERVDTKGITQPQIDFVPRSEEHTSELQSRPHLVCRLLLEKKKKQ